MKHSIHFWQVMGFAFTSVAGTLLHFLFDWSGGNVVVSLFSAVNESIWEHLKLLFFPMLLFAWLEYCIIGKRYGNFWCVKLLGMLAGLILIPVLYYTYTGIGGKSTDIINIVIFYIAAAATYRLESKMLMNTEFCRISPTASILVLCGIAVIFAVLTFHPPHLPLFQDPVTQTYGYADQSSGRTGRHFC